MAARGDGARCQLSILIARGCCIAMRRSAMSAVGLGRAKTQTCCGAVEWGSQTSKFFPSRARLAPWRPLIHRRRNLASSAVPTLLARGSRLTFHAREKQSACARLTGLGHEFNDVPEVGQSFD